MIGKNLEEGNYTIELIKEEKNYNQPILFYQSTNSQALMKTGDIQTKQEELYLNVIHTEVEIKKIDKDTQSIKPSGEGILTGAIYGLYNENNEQIATITIGEDSTGKIENIPFGKYYIQEIKAPTGYQLDKEKHEIEIGKENPMINITLEDEIIKKEITIYKTYDENNKIPEANISFSIYDKNNNKVATIITDENGKASITLPYGEYKIIQENTTEGYHKVEDISLSITNLEDEIITLTDYKIKVPNTNTNFIIYIINLIIRLLNI